MPTSKRDNDEAKDSLDGLCWEIGANLLLMLRVVADESHSDHGKVMTMAGLLAPRAVWEVFWPAWKAVLSQPDFGVAVFHATDCAVGSGEYKGWQPDRKKALTMQLASIVTDPQYNLIGYSFTIPKAPHASLQPRLKKLLKIPQGGPINGSIDDPWFFVLQMLVQAVVADAVRFPPDEKIGFIFDHHHLKGRVPFIYGSLLDIPGYAERLASGVAFQRKEKHVPLQAANLFAYETFRYFNGTVLGPHPERPQHMELRKIVQHGHFMDGAMLNDVVDKGEMAAAERAKNPRSPKARVKWPRGTP